MEKRTGVRERRVKTVQRKLLELQLRYLDSHDGVCSGSRDKITIGASKGDNQRSLGVSFPEANQVD